MTPTATFRLDEAEDLALAACRSLGVTDASAHSLVAATLSAARHGPTTLGFPHFVDYLNAFREGRINCDPSPIIDQAFPAFLTSDADRGIAQLAFDVAFDRFVDAARQFGIAILTQSNSYTTGQLGYYVRRLTERGLVGLAATNANAMMVASAGGPKVYSTNPMAFGFPLGENCLPLIIDQATSATAFVNIVRAVAEGKPIPAGWAVDPDGADTQDPAKAIAGALLPFGGRKGSNIALFVEMLSAGLSGGAWSLDAPDFRSGEASPAVGLTIIAMMPGRPEDSYVRRAHTQVERLAESGVFIPGVTGRQLHHPECRELQIPQSAIDAVRSFIKDQAS